MEKNTFTIDKDKKTVTLCHETKVLDGSMIFETTFDMSNVKFERMLKRMADAEVISWRSRVGIKGLTKAEVEAKELVKTVVDCSKTVERVKHVETPAEKELKKLMNDALAKGGDLKDIMANLRKLMAEKDAAAEEEVAE